MDDATKSMLTAHDRCNAARDALKATLAGRLWYRKRRGWVRRFAKARADEYDRCMRASFMEMAR